MTAHRAALVVGGTVLLAGAGLMWLPGTAAQQQRTGASTTGPVHSIKITLGPSEADGKDCQLHGIAPEAAGVYGRDTLTLNVENGCSMEATVLISDFKAVTGSTRLFTEREPWAKPVSVPARDRRHLEATIVGEAPEEPALFEYTVALKGAETSIRKGRVHLCRQPPCPPTFTGPIKR